jgi:hypothetical protein
VVFIGGLKLSENRIWMGLGSFACDSIGCENWWDGGCCCIATCELGKMRVQNWIFGVELHVKESLISNCCLVACLWWEKCQTLVLRKIEKFGAYGLFKIGVRGGKEFVSD